MGEANRRLLAEELPKWEIALESGEQRAEGKKNIPALCSLFSALSLEIGFGSGEHLLHRAKQNPDALHIGCEVYVHGLLACLKELKKDPLANVRIFTEDGRLLLQNLPEGALSRVYILFPDPWPKNRHHKRRIINPETLALLHRAMHPGAELHLATDHPHYAAWMLAHLANHSGFEWLAECAEDWHNPPEGHCTTRYEQKRKAGSAPGYFQFRRV